MKTVHLIFNAHLDPIWQWPWSAGLDEVLATCRNGCDRLDLDLFARIRSHVEAGRWEIVGGWCIQPDCNTPSGLDVGFRSITKAIDTNASGGKHGPGPTR